MSTFFFHFDVVAAAAGAAVAAPFATIGVCCTHMKMHLKFYAKSPNRRERKKIRLKSFEMQSHASIFNFLRNNFVQWTQNHCAFCVCIFFLYLLLLRLPSHSTHLHFYRHLGFCCSAFSRLHFSYFVTFSVSLTQTLYLIL